MLLTFRCFPAWCRLAGLILAARFALVTAASPAASDGRVLKVLPFLVDTHGRHALAPSLFQRDAYQAHLRKHPDEVSTVRYDVQWQSRLGAKTGGSANLKLRLSLRTAQRTAQNPLILEAPATPGFFGRTWTTLEVEPEAFRAAGKVLAWRIVLLDGDRELAAQQSFLW